VQKKVDTDKFCNRCLGAAGLTNMQISTTVKNYGRLMVENIILIIAENMMSIYGKLSVISTSVF